jgi:serine/threonine protein kinase
VLDKGILQDPEGNNLEFAVIEYCQMSVRDYINTNCGPNDRKCELTLQPIKFNYPKYFLDRVLRVALGALKGLYDMHRQGILHRDVKPENMGMIRLFLHYSH